MIDVGNPFSKPFQEIVDGLVDSLQLGVEQPGTLELVFRSGTMAYALKGAGPVSGLASRITGHAAGKPAIFSRGQHYTFAVGQLVWQPLPAAADPDVTATWFPDDNSRLAVGYFYRDLPSGITDFNAGSVAGTLVRAISREFKLLYEQVDQAYQRAFIDHAQGVALDNVVALLGIIRNPALPAQGEVTFRLKKAAKNDIQILAGVRVADAQGRLFKVTAPGVIKAGLSQTNVPVVALEAGPEGNLGSDSLTVMPTPPRGIDGGVTNDKPLTGGTAAETDEQLRERAKHALDRAGNATLDAIRYAVLNIDGVDSVEVRDFSIDESIPMGEVWVRYSTGKSDIVGPQVQQVVDRTRAAGIKARVSEVAAVTISGALYAIPDIAASGKEACERYKKIVVDALKSFGIGEPISARKLASLVFRVPGLADVGEVQLAYARGNDPAKPILTDPFVLAAGEQARPDIAKVQVVPMQALAASAAGLAADGTLTATLAIADDAGKKIKFRHLELALVATVRGKPTVAPNQPLQQVAQTVGKVVFTDTDQAAPSFPKIEIPTLATLDKASLEVSIQAAAYPGIAAGNSKLATA